MTPIPDPLDTPRELGFAMPPEWEEHAATWMAYPKDDALWFGQLSGVRAEYAELVRTVARFERVELLVGDPESEADVQARLERELESGAVRLHRTPFDDSWIRDSGPLFVRSAQGEVALTDWQFNSWGGKFEWEHDNRLPAFVAGTLGMQRWERPEVLEGGGLEIGADGLALTTRSCLLTNTRNPGLTEEGYTFLLGDYLGVKKLLWLDGGLENDHTDGHIDTITRFVGPGVVVTSVADDPEDANHAPMAANLQALRQMRLPGGGYLEVHALPLPERRLEGAEGRLPPTYANFYIGNGFVAVPLYGDPQDEAALAVLRPLFPGREVIGLKSRAIIEGGGSFHCLTQQQPAGPVWVPGGDGRGSLTG